MSTLRVERIQRMENQQATLCLLLRGVLQELREKAATITHIECKAIAMEVIAMTSGQEKDIENARSARLAASEGKNPRIQKQAQHKVDSLQRDSDHIKKRFEYYRLPFLLKRDDLRIARQIEDYRRTVSGSTDGVERVRALIEIARLSWEPDDFRTARCEALRIEDPDNQALALAGVLEGLRDLNCG